MRKPETVRKPGRLASFILRKKATLFVIIFSSVLIFRSKYSGNKQIPEKDPRPRIPRKHRIEFDKLTSKTDNGEPPKK